MYVIRRKVGEGVVVRVGDVTFTIKQELGRMVFDAGPEVEIRRGLPSPGDGPLVRSCSNVLNVSMECTRKYQMLRSIVLEFSESETQVARDFVEALRVRGLRAEFRFVTHQEAEPGGGAVREQVLPAARLWLEGASDFRSFLDAFHGRTWTFVG